MAHLYSGVDTPAAIIPTPSTAGKGIWSAAELTDDGDDRDAGSAMAAAETALDRTNFLAWRMINIIEGGVYAFTTLIDIANRWTMRGRIKLLGALAWFGHRAPIHISGADATLTLTDGDTFTLDSFTHGATRTYSFAPASDAPALYRFRIRSDAVPPTVDGSGGSNDNTTNSGTVLFKLSTGNRAFLKCVGVNMNRNIPWVVDCEYDAALGMIYVVNGEPTSTGLSRPLYAP